MIYLIGQNLVGQNFRLTKFFVGQNFRYHVKISSILSKEYFCPTNFCPKLWLGVVHVFAVF